MTTDHLPQVPDEQLPAVLRERVPMLEGQGVDTRFHRYMSHSHRVADFYWGSFYPRLFVEGSVPRRTKEIARLVLAAISGCPFCRAQDIESALAHGVSQDEVDAALGLDLTALPAADAAVADLAQRMSPFLVAEPLDESGWQTLREHFDDEQVSELLMCIAVLAGVGRMLAAAGFIEQVCAVGPGAPGGTSDPT